MSEEEEKILVDRFSKLAGHWVGLFGSNASGGRLGARLAARFLPEDVHEIALVPLPPDETVALAARVLASLSEPVNQTPLDEDKYALRVVVGAAVLNLNPAVVTLQLIATTPTSTTIRVRGVAKEGLIRQRAGRKATERVAGALRASARPRTDQS